MANAATVNLHNGLAPLAQLHGFGARDVELVEAAFHVIGRYRPTLITVASPYSSWSQMHAQSTGRRGHEWSEQLQRQYAPFFEFYNVVLMMNPL